MKNLDIVARREAMHWRENINQSAFPATGCPHDVNGNEKWDQLRAMRPEYYGRVARVIDRVLESAHANADNLPPLGLRRWDSSVVATSEIGTFQDLALAFKSTLEMQTQDTLIEMRTPTETEDNFDEFLALNTLLRYRDGVRGIGLSDINLALYAGIGTAVQVSAVIMDALAKNPAIQDADLSRSFGPLLKIASSDTQTLSRFIEHFIHGKESLVQELCITRSGVIDFADFNSLVERFKDTWDPNDQEYMDNNVRIGCPVIFKPKQLAQFWAWQIDAARKCGLFPVIYISR